LRASELRCLLSILEDWFTVEAIALCRLIKDPRLCVAESGDLGRLGCWGGFRERRGEGVGRRDWVGRVASGKRQALDIVANKGRV